ncbi:hypothetical protein [Umezawaea sp. Da 62-37]|uniref:hypothetical protein n=1 Tax=Umezawaea sp. Da 62-37 TaxID=3075927 RepID=UPI0028F71348|nr:hypothetical protein [Umezawaea sp. Da 62-37]WNV82920.1 hypothetical protein RM788_32605 [Umezawaea sp. Da 62-37]
MGIPALAKQSSGCFEYRGLLVCVMLVDVTSGVVEPRVLLIDLENSVGAVRPRRRVLLARVEALLAAAGPVHHAVAGYAGADLADDPTASTLAELGVSALRVAPAPDAAEEALLAHAGRVYASLGCRAFVVASGDRRFTQLARLGRLELVAWDGQSVAARLEDAAHLVRRVPRPTSGTADGGETVEPSMFDVAETGGIEVTPVRPTVRGDDVRTMVTAVLAGVGVGLGQRLADVLLRRL